MRGLFKIFSLLASLTGLSLWSGGVYAVACTSIANTAWNLQTTWGGAGVGCVGAPGGIPGAADDVTIATNVTLNNDRSVTSLTVNAGATLTLNSNNLTVSGNIIINGTVADPARGATGYLQSTGNTAAVSGNGSFTGEASLYFAGTGPSIAAGSTLGFSGRAHIQTGRNGNSTVAGSVLTINGTLTSTLAAGNNLLQLYADSTIIGSTGIINAASPTIRYRDNSATLTNNGTVTIGDVVDRNAANVWTNAAGSTLNVSGALMATGVLTATAAGNTVNYNGAAQTGKVTTYDNLTLSGSGAKTFATTPTVNGVLSMEGTATVTVTAGVVTYGANATLQYNTATARTVSAEEWITPFAATGGVIIANTGVITVDAAKTLSASAPLTVNSGATLATGTSVITVNGDVNNSGTITSSSGSITLSGGAGAHTLAGIGVYANLVLNDAFGAVLTGSPSVSAVLTLTIGIITTGTNVLEVTSNCTTGIAGASAAGHVLGNLTLHYPTNAGTTTCTFPIGSAGVYAPATVAMVNVSSTLANSSLTARTDAGDHADTTADISGVDPARSVNRYWTLIPGGSLTFATYNTTFTFVAGDIDGGANFANFIVGRKNSGVWTYPALGARNPTDTTATGMTALGGFGVFVVGEPSFPLLTHLKTVSVTSDPVNGATNPKNIPGAEVLYNLRVTNSGGPVDNNTTVITDPIPTNTELYVGDLGGAGSGPIVFVQGTPTSTLTWTFTSLASLADDIDFSNDNGVTWTYVPVPVGGYDPAVNRIRLNPKGIMAGGGAYFELRFRVRVK